MKRRKAYAAVAVKDLNLEAVRQRHPGQAVVVGVDIGKFDCRAVLRWETEQFERPWRFHNPTEIGLVVDKIRQLGQGRRLIVAMESSGTYGDALRFQLHQAQVEVRRVSSKASHDYAEIFDGVPSQHDGKDAAVVAELAALGKATPWPFVACSAWEEELRYAVAEWERHRKQEQMTVGNLEALLARHWPEATRVLRHTSGTLMRALAHYGSAQALAADAQAVARLQKWGGRYLPAGQAQALVASAQTTVGVPPGPWMRRRIQELADHILAARATIRCHGRQLRRLATGHAVLEAHGAVIGVPTACVLWSCLGDPRQYDSAAAYRKALGLNLRERSSGKFQGKLRLSKRGSSRGRQWLYYAALRLVQKAGVRPWYEAKKARDGNAAKGALVAVMRKLMLALYAVAVHGEPFEVQRLFPPAARRMEAKRV